MRCLVTGASGFLGSHLVRELLNRGYSVVILLRSSGRAKRLEDCLPSVSIARGSLDDLTELQRSLEREPVDAAFHLAWSGVSAQYHNCTEQITYNIIHSLGLWRALYKTGCRTLIGVGSQAEYGPYLGTLTEDIPTFPITDYGSAKLALGILLKQLCVDAEMRFVWMRLFSAYGPADDERHMIPGLIWTLMRNKRPRLTAGEQIWDYLYVSDAVNALCACLESDAVGIFNLGSGEPSVLRDFVRQVRDCIDPSLPLGFGEVPYSPSQIMHLVAGIGRLKAATGWSPKIGTLEGIRKTVAWHISRAQFNPVL